MAKKHAQKSGEKRPLSVRNRKASFDVNVEKTFEAGIVLTGDEIKSIRSNHVQLNGGYVKLRRPGGPAAAPEAVLIGLHLSKAQDPERTRKLLLHAGELRELDGLLSAKGRAVVPLSLFLRRGWAKVSLGVGSGRKQYDKRRLLRERDLAREQAGELKRSK